MTGDATGGSVPVASIIIPAHNEAAVIGDLLALLLDGRRDRFQIIVVCNGCTDDTAAVAQRFGPDIEVIAIAEPSKRSALARGDDAADHFPRVYIDADVEISGDSVEALVDALADGRWLAVGPERVVPRDGMRPWVRWYYDVWEQLPQVRSGLYGRGVIALSAAGIDRVRSLPALMGDDLVASEAFEPDERAVVADAHVVVWPPRTMGDLIRRRTRAVTGNAEADRHGVRRSSSVTTWRSLVDICRDRPRLAPRVPVFVVVGLVSRVRAGRATRRRDTTTWLRDESSRRRNHPGG